MPRKLKCLSGNDVVNIMHIFGFDALSPKGSHAKLRRIGTGGEKQTLTIPLHNELDVGTIRAIVRQAARYIPQSELNAHFYTEQSQTTPSRHQFIYVTANEGGSFRSPL